MTDDKKTLIPEIVDDPDSTKNKSLEKKSERLPEVSAAPRRLPFLNRFEKKRIESYTEVVRAETSLMDAVGSHARTKGRLRDIDVEIETEHLERLNRLQEQRKLARRFKPEEELEDLEYQVKKRHLMRQLDELDRPKKTSELDKLREDLQRSLLRQEVIDEHEFNLKIQKMKTQIKTEAALEDLIYKMYEDLGLAHKDPDDFTDDERRREASIYTVYDKIKAGLL